MVGTSHYFLFADLDSCKISSEKAIREIETLISIYKKKKKMGKEFMPDKNKLYRDDF